MNSTPCIAEPPSALALDPDSEHPPHCTGDLAKCRIGDWEQPAFVIEWFGQSGVQRYQPGQRDPFDVEHFDPGHPVWLFERAPHPTCAQVRGLPCEVWRRIA